MNVTERRSAALLFGEELALGEIDASALDTPEVVAAVRDRPVPSRVSRRMQRRAVARGSLDYEGVSAAPMLAARRAVLGDRAAGPPRFLVRVEQFPAAGDLDGDGGYARFHEIMRAHQLPYLLAIVPHAGAEEWRYLNDAEIEMLARLHDDGAAFGLGGLDHSALPAREPAELAGLLDRAEGALVQHGIAPDVFVPPGDLLEATQYTLLAGRYAVVTGGDASIATMGWHPTPLWRGSAVYMPAYAPLGGGSRLALDAVERLIAAQAALWVPVALRWQDELAAEDELVALCRALRGHTRSWDEFQIAVRASAAA